MLRIFDSATLQPAAIPAHADAGRRPMFSVMVPTFEPDDKLLVALRSVLAQEFPPDQMQIAVVDDGSTPGLARHLVQALGVTGRVEVVEHRQRLGLAGNWNRAVALARGELVHLLHQDDYVRPGFYAAIDRGFRAAPHAGMAFCRSRIVDGGGRTLKSSSRLRWRPGLLVDWLPRIVERQRIQTPAAVVRREVYEAIGSYRTELRQTVDWDMWVRIAARYPVWYEPACLAVYRRHPNNESARLLASGAVWPDVIRAIELNAAALPAAIREPRLRASARWHTASALRTAERLLADGAVEQAAITLEHVPALLRMSGGTEQKSTVQQRLTNLRLRIGRLGRRAA